MDSSKLLIVGGVVLGGFYLYNKNKKDAENAKILANAQSLALANAQSQTPPTQTTAPAEDLTGFYTPAEATKKALEVVTKWISLLDSIPKEALTQENKNVINRRIWAENDKQAKIGYDKALALAKSKNQPKFTFQDTTYYTATEDDVRSNSSNYFVNSFKNSREAILMSALEIARMSNPNDSATLGDYVKYVKTQEFSRIYDILKEVFTTIPKSDVNKLVVLLPKYLMAGNDNFAYFQTEYEKNPFTIEEQLYLKDINIEQLMSPRKKPMLPNSFFQGQVIETIKTPIFATASLIQSAR